MGDEVTCPICARPMASVWDGPDPTKCFSALGDDCETCWRLGYEREKARAEKAEAEAQAQHERWCNDVVDHCPHPTEDAVCCSECLAATQEALAAARRECEVIRGWARIWKSVAKHSTTELRELTFLLQAGTWPTDRCSQMHAGARCELLHGHCGDHTYVMRGMTK